MTSIDIKSHLETFYCFCTEMSYQEILKNQITHPLEFKQFINEYTRCNQGCGSCVENLYAYLTETNLLIE